ncbi:DoxX family protein [Nonomuraea sp. ATR24]|uniref:DoxX family protein n=1 Tax=Nonomuraea TaxID=83681 RepID=UPI001C5ECB4A|nr:DoxX family protein [Nonomuraea ceibae]
MKRVVFDIAALIARVVIGVIFLAHGLQKWQAGLGATSGMFAESGVPMPQLAAAFVTVAETVGGILLILGLLVRPAALVLLIGMIGAAVFVHAPNGIFVQQGGWELVGALGAASLLFLALGGGRFGLDGILGVVYRRRAERRAAERDAAAGATTTVDRPAPDTKAAYPDERHSVPRQPAEHERTQAADYDRTQASEYDRTQAAEPAERPHPAEHRPGGLSEEDMRDVDAVVNDQPTRPKPPNR